MSRPLNKKYAAELAKASPEQEKQICARLLEEQQQREEMLNHQPSAGTLW